MKLVYGFLHHRITAHGENGSRPERSLGLYFREITLKYNLIYTERLHCSTDFSVNAALKYAVSCIRNASTVNIVCVAVRAEARSTSQRIETFFVSRRARSGSSVYCSTTCCLSDWQVMRHRPVSFPRQLQQQQPAAAPSISDGADEKRSTVAANRSFDSSITSLTHAPQIQPTFRASNQCYFRSTWRFGVVVTALYVSTKLLYVGTG